MTKAKGIIKRHKWYDISLFKLSVFSATLFLLTIWPWLRNVLLSVGWYWYLILMIITMIPVIKKMYF